MSVWLLVGFLSGVGLTCSFQIEQNIAHYFGDFAFRCFDSLKQVSNLTPNERLMSVWLALYACEPSACIPPEHHLHAWCINVSWVESCWIQSVYVPISGCMKVCNDNGCPSACKQIASRESKFSSRQACKVKWGNIYLYPSKHCTTIEPNKRKGQAKRGKQIIWNLCHVCI